MKAFDLTAVKPFFADEPEKLANVSLRLDHGCAASFHQDKRTFAELSKCSKAAQQIAHLPECGESRHCVLKGDFALMDFIPASMALAESHIDELLVATLSLSQKNAADLGAMMQAGQVKSMAILVSHYFAAANQVIYDQIVEVCRANGGRIVAMRTHAKILLMTIGDRHLVVESSANLRSCHNVENATVFNDPGLYAFHRSWMTELLESGEEHAQAQAKN